MALVARSVRPSDGWSMRAQESLEVWSEGVSVDVSAMEQGQELRCKAVHNLVAIRVAFTHL